jgi:hypothetical protein
MDIQLTGVLTDGDSKQHIAHTFVVGAGAGAIRLHFTYAPKRGPAGLNLLTLTLFDPQGFRGAGHRHGDVQAETASDTVELRADRATPGYLPGPLPAGEWTLVIDTHLIVPGEPVSYTLQIATAPAAEGGPAAAEAAGPQPSSPRGPGWYRGDLHAHTVHSDGGWQIPDLIDAAIARGLDFMTLSDHNTTSGLAEFARLAAGRITTIDAIELTTFWGHALALGAHGWVDWRVRPGARSMPDIAAEVTAAGGLFVIAHPMSPGDPICTGCNWGYADMMPGPAGLVEVWNGGDWLGDSNNEQALALYYSWLNQGLRLVATAGTDTHDPSPAGVPVGFNVVYAEDLSAAAILEAIGRGHLYLSDGPTAALSGRGEGEVVAMMGDRLPAGPATIEASWAGCAVGDRARLIVDGQVLVEREASAPAPLQWLVAGARWCALELRGPGGRLRALTNPIFFG